VAALVRMVSLVVSNHCRISFVLSIQFENDSQIATAPVFLQQYSQCQKRLLFSQQVLHCPFQRVEISKHS
jgi:hypothetical protein